MGQLHHGLPPKNLFVRSRHLAPQVFIGITLPETNIAFENGWWENCFPFGFWDGFLGVAIVVLGSLCFGLMICSMAGGFSHNN